MRMVGRVALVAAWLSLPGNSASAQQGRGFGMGAAGAFVVRAPNVQKELKFTAEQTAKVQDSIQQIVEKYRDQMSAVRELPEDERPAKFRALVKSVADDVKSALAMTPEQSQRYDQIVLQQRGIWSFTDPVIQSRLQLTDEQKQRIRDLDAQARQRFDEIRKDARDNFDEARIKFDATRKDFSEKGVAHLSDDQKKIWKSLTGEPFEVQFDRPGQ
ncbi:MAG: hypothetical protein P4L84_21085 [Isosphaeraceae bacterium]|nr:hypothetical protein [Isosphaeraceae bacterium]